METVTAEQVRSEVLSRTIREWCLRTCSLCCSPIGYVFCDDRVTFDSGCDCSPGYGPEPRSYADVAASFNMQTTPGIAEKMWAEFIGCGTREPVPETSVSPITVSSLSQAGMSVVRAYDPPVVYGKSWSDVQREIDEAAGEAMACVAVQSFDRRAYERRQAAPRIIAEALRTHGRPGELLAEMVEAGALKIEV